MDRVRTLQHLGGCAGCAARASTRTIDASTLMVGHVKARAANDEFQELNPGVCLA